VSHSNPIPSDLIHSFHTDSEILSYLKRDFPQTTQTIFTFDKVVNDIYAEGKQNLFLETLSP
jgi:hypothetical protein